MLFFILFILWIIFNGRITLEVCLLGLAIAVTQSWFCHKYIGYSSDSDKLLSFRKLPLILHYAGTLIWEILKANVQVIRITLASELDFEPCIVYFRTDLKKQLSKVVLANSITLTPGTITISLEDDLYCVHCLDESMGEGLSECSFVQILRKIERI